MKEAQGRVELGLTACYGSRYQGPTCPAAGTGAAAFLPPRTNARVSRNVCGASNTRITFSSEPLTYVNLLPLVNGRLATQVKS